VKPAKLVIGRDDTIGAMSDEILTAVADDIATITLNRPDKRNAMNAPMLSGLRRAFDELDGRRDVRVIVVRGAGPAFCAGMDLREMEAQRGAIGDPDESVVAILHCDLRIMADGARIGMPLSRIGLVVPFPLGQKLVEIIGAAETRRLLFTGRLIEAARAKEIGMVHEIVPAADVEKTTYELARTIADNAPLSLAGMKATIQRTLSARGAIAHADLDAQALAARQSADASEGRRAMLEKRKPNFRGE
jgi:enoyl-CoA hydratase